MQDEEGVSNLKDGLAVAAFGCSAVGPFALLVEHRGGVLQLGQAEVLAVDLPAFVPEARPHLDVCNARNHLEPPSSRVSPTGGPDFMPSRRVTQFVGHEGVRVVGSSGGENSGNTALGCDCSGQDRGGTSTLVSPALRRAIPKA